MLLTKIVILLVKMQAKIDKYVCKVENVDANISGFTVLTGVKNLISGGLEGYTGGNLAHSKNVPAE